jgi:hypothetical protein
MSVSQDAREFGLHLKQGGWRLGLLVARNVEKGKGTGGDSKRHRNDRYGGGKVSAQEFARESVYGTAPRVLRHLAAWERAADEGLVPHAADLMPDTDAAIDVEALPPWTDYYDASDAGGRPRDSKPADAVAIIERQSVESRGEIVAQLLTDPETREAVVDHVRGAAAVESMHHTIQTKRAPVGQPELVMPPSPEFASAFWRAAGAVHTAHAELMRWGVRDLEADHHTREAAESLRSQAAEVGHAVADFVVDNIPTEDVA